jgi:RNA polymerase sigma-70 factor (ECF subfamily)
MTSAEVRDCARVPCSCALLNLTGDSCPAQRPAADRGEILPEFLAAFHDAHRIDFLKYVRLRNFSHQDAEDIVSDAFLTLYKARDRWWESGNATAFAFKVVRDAVADHCRRADRRPAEYQLDQETETRVARTASPNEEIDGLIALLDLTNAISSLPEHQADCMRLSIILGRNNKEIADFLGITPSTVRTHLYLARQHLAALLEDTSRKEGAAG